MSNAWKKAAEESRAAVAEISSRVSGYSYETPEQSRGTDEALFSFVREHMRRVGDAMHDVMNTGFELHKDDLGDRARNALDIALGIESRTGAPGEWPRLPMEFLKKLIMKDSVIALGSEQIADEAEALADGLREAAKADETYKKERPALTREVDALAQSLDNLYAVLREREKLRSVRTDQLKKAADDFD